MDKYFVCLANSYKRGGRCLAGIEIAYSQEGQWEIVRNENGTPHWIRPIADTTYGEIPYHVANNIKLLSVVKLTDIEACPECTHSENVHYSQIEVSPLSYSSEQNVLNLFVDNVHQSVFGNRGKAVSADMVPGLNYSLMLIHAENVLVYVDENREKAKNRMKFNYFGAEYGLPITDPAFLEMFRSRPEHIAIIPGVFLTLSLGLEYEGWHHKLVAGVIIPKETSLQQNVTPNPQRQNIQSDWFNEYEQELAWLLDQKADIEEQINELRQKIMKQMEDNGVDRIHSQQFSICYTPAKAIIQFDSKAFRAENEELYSLYCKPKYREASIIVKRIKEE